MEINACVSFEGGERARPQVSPHGAHLGSSSRCPSDHHEHSRSSSRTARPEGSCRRETPQGDSVSAHIARKSIEEQRREGERTSSSSSSMRLLRRWRRRRQSCWPGRGSRRRGRSAARRADSRCARAQRWSLSVSSAGLRSGGKKRRGSTHSTTPSTWFLTASQISLNAFLAASNLVLNASGSCWTENSLYETP